MSTEKVFDIIVEQKVRLTQENVNDILESAFNGGITYWADDCEIVGERLGEFASEQISRGGKLRIHDGEEDEWLELDIINFLEGFSKWAGEGYDRYHAIENGKVDTGEIDGECADCIIQFALFGEIIYG